MNIVPTWFQRLFGSKPAPEPPRTGGAGASGSWEPPPARVPRGVRNANPGNIREAPDDPTKWVGERATDDDPAFEEFDTPEAGIRALALILRNYQRKRGLRSVAAIIGRWAPPSENDTNAYIRAVCATLNVNPQEPLDMNNRTTLIAMVRAIIRHENGLNPYPSSVIEAGVDAALGVE